MEFDKLFEDLKEDGKTNEMEPAEVQNLYIFKKCFMSCIKFYNNIALQVCNIL